MPGRGFDGGAPVRDHGRSEAAMNRPSVRGERSALLAVGALTVVALGLRLAGWRGNRSGPTRRSRSPMRASSTA